MTLHPPNMGVSAKCVSEDADLVVCRNNYAHRVGMFFNTFLGISGSFQYLILG